MGEAKVRKPIELHGSVTPMEVMVEMAEGNPGALTAIMAIINKDTALGIIDLCHLDDMNMRGPQIWVGYKDYCGHDIDKFIDCIRDRDPQMVAKVNEVMDPQGFDHKARVRVP